MEFEMANVQSMEIQPTWIMFEKFEQTTVTTLQAKKQELLIRTSQADSQAHWDQRKNIEMQSNTTRKFNQWKYEHSQQSLSDRVSRR